MLPEVEKLVGVNQPPNYHRRRRFYTFKLMLNLSKKSKNCSSFNKELVYSILFHDISKPEMYMEEKQDDGSLLDL